MREDVAGIGDGVGSQLDGLGNTVLIGAAVVGGGFLLIQLSGKK